MAITHNPPVKNTNTLGFILVEEFEGSNLVARQTYPRTQDNERLVSRIMGHINDSDNSEHYLRVTYLTTQRVQHHVPRSKEPV